jgi:hypothetical protein
MSLRRILAEEGLLPRGRPRVGVDPKDKVQVLNENGRKVWVTKKTLKGPKGKNYKPIKEDKPKEEKAEAPEDNYGGMSLSDKQKNWIDGNLTEKGFHKPGGHPRKLPGSKGKMWNPKTLKKREPETYAALYEEWAAPKRKEMLKRISDGEDPTKEGLVDQGKKPKEEAQKGSAKNWKGEMSRPTLKKVDEVHAKLKGLNPKAKPISDPWGQFQGDPDLGRILSKGKEMSTKGIIQKPMAAGQCHWNSSKLFQKGEVDAIVIGYAYNPRQGWFQHTWGQKDGKVVETTGDNSNSTHYFGVPLTGDEATAFADWTEKNPPGGGVVRKVKK